MLTTELGLLSEDAVVSYLQDNEYDIIAKKLENKNM